MTGRALRRLFVLATMLFAALNTRTVIAALPPIVDFASEDLGLSASDLIVLSMLPPLCYAIFAASAPLLVARSGLERSMAIVLATITVGHIVRAASGSSNLFIAGTVAVLAGIGVGNVLLPPLVRRHFGGRIGTVTALYVAAHTVGTAVPAWVGVPLSNAVGWRIALGTWAVCALVGLFVWLFALGSESRRRSDPAALVSVSQRGRGRPYRSITAWAIAALFAIAAGHAYAALAWLALVVVDLAGASTEQAGSMVALYAAAGFIPGIAAPLIAVRARRIDVLVHLSGVLLVVGYLGLIFAPTVALELWVFCAGAGAAYFALCLVLINTRTRTPEGTVAVSAFVQGVGYVVGAAGPLAVGLIHYWGSSWRVAIFVLLVTTVIVFSSGVLLRKERFIEDEWLPRLRS